MPGKSLEDKMFNRLTPFFERLEGQYQDLSARFEKLEGQYQDLSARFEKQDLNLHKAFVETESKLSETIDSINDQFKQFKNSVMSEEGCLVFAEVGYSRTSSIIGPEIDISPKELYNENL